MGPLRENNGIVVRLCQTRNYPKDRSQNPQKSITDSAENRPPTTFGKRLQATKIQRRTHILKAPKLTNPDSLIRPTREPCPVLRVASHPMRTENLSAGSADGWAGNCGRHACQKSHPAVGPRYHGATSHFNLSAANLAVQGSNQSAAARFAEQLLANRKPSVSDRV
jgi:hypothetical protein